MIDYKEEYLRLLRERLTDYKYSDFLYCLPVDETPLVLGETRTSEVFEYNTLNRMEGKDFPLHGETMVGLVRLMNLHQLAQNIAKDQIVGDFLEAGVWRGGAGIYLAALNRAFCNGEKTLWLADSFQGLPKPSRIEDAHMDLSVYSELAVSLEEVQQNFKNYRLLNDRVRFVKGWFKDTLPNIEVDKISLLRLDGDYYESTMDILQNLYDKVTLGGYIVVDDYALASCKNAVTDFREKNQIKDEIIEIDWTGVYWQKT